MKIDYIIIRYNYENIFKPLRLCYVETKFMSRSSAFTSDKIELRVQPPLSKLNQGMVSSLITTFITKGSTRASCHLHETKKIMSESLKKE